jgi:hypothetical protein
MNDRFHLPTPQPLLTGRPLIRSATSRSNFEYVDDFFQDYSATSQTFGVHANLRGILGSSLLKIVPPNIQAPERQQRSEVARVRLSTETNCT